MKGLSIIEKCVRVGECLQRKVLGGLATLLVVYQQVSIHFLQPPTFGNEYLSRRNIFLGRCSNQQLVGGRVSGCLRANRGGSMRSTRPRSGKFGEMNNPTVAPRVYLLTHNRPKCRTVKADNIPLL